MDRHAPPIAIRTSFPSPALGDRLTTGLNEQFDEALLASDTFEWVSLRDEASDEALFDFATVATRGSSPSGLRFFFSGNTHWSGITIRHATDAIDVPPLSPAQSHLPLLEKSAAPT